MLDSKEEGEDGGVGEDGRGHFDTTTHVNDSLGESARSKVGEVRIRRWRGNRMRPEVDGEIGDSPRRLKGVELRER